MNSFVILLVSPLLEQIVAGTLIISLQFAQKGIPMRLLPLLLSTLLFTACATAKKAPEAAPATQANYFESSYKESAKPPSRKPSAPARIYRGTDKEADHQRLLEDGYDILGYSSFEAGDVAPDQALVQAAKVNADLVLVYSKRNGRVPMSVQLEAAKAQAKSADKSSDKAKDAPPSGRVIAPQASHFEYFASYWTKLAPPVLGLHVQAPNKDAALDNGLPVLAVIKGSPAAAAEIRAGDSLMRIGDTDIRSVDTLMQATSRYAGQSVEIVYVRETETLSRTVVLNAKSN
jgi:hypothetical protein